MYLLLNLSHYVKSYGYFCQILAFSMMPAHQIWSCHVIHEANFENFLFCPNSTFNIGKIHKISSGKALYFRSYQPKNLTGGGGGGGGGHTSAFRVKGKIINFHFLYLYLNKIWVLRVIFPHRLFRNKSDENEYRVSQKKTFN